MLLKLPSIWYYDEEWNSIEISNREKRVVLFKLFLRDLSHRFHPRYKRIFLDSGTAVEFKGKWLHLSRKYIWIYTTKPPKNMHLWMLCYKTIIDKNGKFYM